MSDSLRFLANDLHLPIVCVGTHEAYQALTTDQQLADRFGEFELPQWRNDASFAQFLKTFGAMFPLRAASDLCEPKIRQRILALTEGVTVRICRVVETAAIAAIREGSETVTLDSFKDSETAAGLVSIADRQRRRERREMATFAYRGVEPGPASVRSATDQRRTAQFLAAARRSSQRPHAS